MALRVGGHHRVADRVERDFGALALDELLLLAGRAARTSSRSAATGVRVSMLIGDDGVVGAAIDGAARQRLVGARARIMIATPGDDAAQLINRGQVAALRQ